MVSNDDGLSSYNEKIKHLLAHQTGILIYPYHPVGRIKTEEPHVGRTLVARWPHVGRMSIRDVIVMLKLRYHIASQRFQELLEVFFLFF